MTKSRINFNSMNRVTPSKLHGDHWAGQKVTGDIYTLEQRRELRAEAGRKVLSFTVRIATEPRRLDEMPETRTFICPVVAETNTGRKVITPSGHRLWIDKVGLNR